MKGRGNKRMRQESAIDRRLDNFNRYVNDSILKNKAIKAAKDILATATNIGQSESSKYSICKKFLQKNDIRD